VSGLPCDVEFDRYWSSKEFSAHIYFIRRFNNPNSGLRDIKRTAVEGFWQSQNSKGYCRIRGPEEQVGGVKLLMHLIGLKLSPNAISIIKYQSRNSGASEWKLVPLSNTSSFLLSSLVCCQPL
jgi:hypothetical protein